ncbi:MAG TPA: hypothetical protein VF812_00960 [Ktedonobacterales bacterium]
MDLSFTLPEPTTSAQPTYMARHALALARTPDSADDDIVPKTERF